MVGVLHSDDAPYYSLAIKHQKQLAACVAVSRRIASRSAELLGELPVTVIPCGIPMSPMIASAEAEREQAKLIWVGRVEEEQKRVSDLPMIAAILRDQGVDFAMTVVGDGPACASLESTFSEYDLGSRTQFLGWQSAEKIHELMSSSDVLLLPSNYEGTPVVMMEALGAGCAVVASRVSGVEDAAGDPLTEGVLHVYDVGKVDEAAVLVMRALQAPSPRRRKQARLAAEGLFSIGKCVDRYASALAKLAKSSGPEGSLAWRYLGTRAISILVASSRSGRRALSSRRMD
jgi:glycosyltransferase involved in cell wall biosynthesis